MIVDPKEYGGLINSTCTIRFPYADNKSRYGRNERSDPHFVSIASTYMVGRNYDDFENGKYGPDAFKFTGFDEVSNPDALDILVFYEQNDCARHDRDISEIPNLPHSEIWEVFNLTTEADGITFEGQWDSLCDFALDCVPNGGALPGVYLGNFNYDIARSVQTYTVPVYGLNKGKEATFPITDYYKNETNCMLPDAHNGHGSVEGCSNATTGVCSNEITFSHDQGKIILININTPKVLRIFKNLENFFRILSSRDERDLVRL